MKRKILILLLTISVGISGCDKFFNNAQEESVSAKPSVESTEPQKEIVPTYSGEIVLSMRIPRTLNPVLNEDATVDRILHLMFEPLFNIDDNFKIVPNLAKSYELSSDGLSAVINLNTNISWSDGIDVTSKDFIFTVEEIKNAPDGSIYKACVENISNCVPLDDHSVRVEFKQYYSGMEYMFTFPLIPEHYYKNQLDPASSKNMTPLGNGAYEFVSYKEIEELSLTAAVTGKKPYIQSIKVIITPDFETDLNSFNQGVTDVLAASFSTWSKYRSARDAKIYEYNTTLYEFVGFNFNNFHLQNKKLREAVARCIDIDEIIYNVYLGSAVKTSSPVNPDSWLYEKGVNEYKFDIAEAEKLLEQSGFIKEQDGIYAKNEENKSEKLKLRLLVNEENEERIKIAENLTDNLTSLGMDIVLEIVDFDEYTTRLFNKDFDMFVGGFNFSVFPDLTFAFHSSNIESGSNYFSYNAPELDIKLKDAFLAVGDIPLYSALSDVQKHISNETVAVSLLFRKSACLTSTRIYGDVKPMINNIYSNIREWFIAN